MEDIWIITLRITCVIKEFSVYIATVPTAPGGSMSKSDGLLGFNRTGNGSAWMPPLAAMTPVFIACPRDDAGIMRPNGCLFQIPFGLIQF